MYSREEVKEECLRYFNGDELAANVFVDKYALKDKQGNILEIPPDMHHRMANEFKRIEDKYPNSMSYLEIFELFNKFKYIIPGGSQMAGVGNNTAITSLSNCFVIDSTIDSYGGIMRADEEQIQIMKRRGGVGHDLSNLRPAGVSANNSILGQMAGTTLYMDRFSNSTREVAQDGRRGALMLSIDVRHPDCDKFIDAKLKEGKVIGANISVRISDEFMRAVEEDGDFLQTFPCIIEPLEDYDEVMKELRYNELIQCLDKYNGNFYIKKIKAKELWNKIIKNAHQSAEPGVLFWDTIIRESPADCYGEQWKTISTNPCIVGSTLIAVADGRNAISIKQLTEEGKDVPVYATDPISGKIHIKWGRNPRKTKERVEVWKLLLDDGSYLIATPDHKVMLKDRSYCDLSELHIGDSLMPFNTYLSEGSWNDGYRCINSKSDGHSRQYRMIYEFNKSVYDGKLFNIHHKDENRLNDCFENLELEVAKKHRSEHKLGQKNPYHTHPNVKANLLEKGRHPGKENGRYIDIPNEEIIKHGKKCLELNNTITRKLWYSYVENCEVKIPNVSSKFRFGSFSHFKSCVIGNHKVKLVEFYGYEDVYNLTVDDFHNYNVITTGDEKYIRSSGITVKNCGEIPLCAYDSCRLTAINLYSYVNDPFTTKANFDYELFKNHINKAQRLMDDLIDLEIEKIDRILNKIESDPEPEEIKLTEFKLWLKIRQKAVDGRRTGLGITAEADMLAALGLRYGTPEATEFSINIHRILAIESYKTSIQLAKERGAFPIYDFTKEVNNPFIKRIYKELSQEDQNNLFLYGRRNIANLTIAPTGTVSLETKTTSGIEPLFKPFYKRKRKVNKSTSKTTTDQNGDVWEEYFVIHDKFKEWFNINWNDYNFYSKLSWTNSDYYKSLDLMSESELNEIFTLSPYYKATANDIDWKESVRMQGEVQKWIDHSISKTVNLPSETTIETVDELYRLAHKSACKGLTIYRDGSREGVLTSSIKEEKKEFEYLNSIKIPKERECDIYHKTALKKSWTIIVGKVDNKPVEIFAFSDTDNSKFPTNITKGIVRKEKSRLYSLTSKGSEKTYKIDSIVDLMTDLDGIDTRKYSLMLRHRINPQFIIDQIREYATISSFDKVIEKVLMLYVKEERSEKELCPNCKSKLVRQEGCVKCTQCEWSKCG